MNLRCLALSSAWLVAGVTLVQCGSSSTSPTGNPTPPVVAPTPTPTASPTPSLGLPPGMTCNPTPPPILRMHVKVHAADDKDRIVLDSKPVVVNVDHYCDRVGFGDWKFCDTRPEGDAQRVACDYLVAGKAEDTGRWGPTWFFRTDLCSYFPDNCVNHPTEQFMVIAKSKGTFEACASDAWPVAENGSRCGTIEMK
jgi:hypothetical protein